MTYTLVQFINGTMIKMDKFDKVFFLKIKVSDANKDVGIKLDYSSPYFNIVGTRDDKNTHVRGYMRIKSIVNSW